MTAESDMEVRSFGSRLALCTATVDALPTEPIDVDERDAEVIRVVEGVLRDGLAYDERYLKDLSADFCPSSKPANVEPQRRKRGNISQGANTVFRGPPIRKVKATILQPSISEPFLPHCRLIQSSA